MATLDVEFEAVSDADGRYAHLARLLGLADHDHARGKVEHLWMACTTRGETDLPQWLVEEHLGERGPAALIEAGLARWSRGRGDAKSRRMYICGSSERCLWMRSNKDIAAKGGKARAASASRKGGKFTSGRLVETNQLRDQPEPAPSPSPSPSPDPEIRTLPSARVIPPSTEPGTTPTPAHGIGPTLDELWSELETARQRVSTTLGMTLQPLVAHDSGRADLAAALVDASSKGKRAELAAQVRHAIAVAASEAEADPKELQWFSGAIFRPNNFRRLAAAPSPKAKRKAPIAAQASQPLQFSTLTPEERIALAAEANAALYGAKEPT